MQASSSGMSKRLLELLGVEHPILLAPMAGSAGADLAIAVANAGGLGSLPCALLTHERIRSEVDAIRRSSSRPLNLNFFCHTELPENTAREARWKARLEVYYRELGIDASAPVVVPTRTPFNDALCDIVMDLRPEVVSFHFGLPDSALLEHVRSTGAKILSTATTVAEAVWLEQHGCDAVIAQGVEAGGHRGMFLTSDPASQVGTMALVPLIVDAVSIPVIAAGGIADARGIAAAFALGAAAVQLGTAYLRCKESAASSVHRQALATASEESTAVTNVFTGRLARGIVNRLMRDLGAICADAPEFPHAAKALAPLRARAEASGSGDFSPLWAGQAVTFARETDAGALTRELAEEAAALSRGRPR